MELGLSGFFTANSPELITAQIKGIPLQKLLVWLFREDA